MKIYCPIKVCLKDSEKQNVKQDQKEQKLAPKIITPTHKAEKADTAAIRQQKDARINKLSCCFEMRKTSVLRGRSGPKVRS